MPSDRLEHEPNMTDWRISGGPADESFRLTLPLCCHGVRSPPRKPAVRLPPVSRRWWTLAILSISGSMITGVLTSLAFHGWILAVSLLLGGIGGLLCAALGWVANDPFSTED